ncbi:50S ribosomal protein L5 [uncultured archaeon]|nr:50S ribosomal protein L5 [uncultured archaeon]
MSEKTNPMLLPRLEKVVLNIGVGESGERLVKAEALLTKLTGRKPVRTVSTKRIPQWTLRKGEPIGCKVTLRGKPAEEVLKRCLYAKDNVLTASHFDASGNLSFGIQEYIDIQGIKYDPDIGIFGLNICATIERPGGHVKRRSLRASKIPQKARLTPEESIEFMKQKFGVKIGSED